MAKVNFKPLKLSRTEALILAQALENAKWGFVQNSCESKTSRLICIRKLNELQERLEVHSEDGRMNGRKLIWDFTDRLRWWVFGNPNRHKLPKDEQKPSTGPDQGETPSLFSL